ncbi:hypothetical protein D3C72_2500150 [compost metagenome]
MRQPCVCSAGADGRLLPVAAAPAVHALQMGALQAQSAVVVVPVPNHQLVGQCFGIVQEQPLVGEAR